MKRKFTFWSLVLVLFLSACGGGATVDTFDVPEELGNEYFVTHSGNTDWYIPGAEGIYNDKTGWTVFNFEYGQIYAIFETLKNPTDENEPFGLNFDIQWVQNGSVMKHAMCFSVENYNDNLQNGWGDEKSYDFNPPYTTGTDQNWESLDASKDYKFGCHFEGDDADWIYFVHHHLVNSKAVQALTDLAPTETQLPTATPTFTPGPGTPTAVIPTATITVTGGTVPFACGDLSLSGNIDWSKVSLFVLDCVNSRVQVKFLGDNLDKSMVQFEINQVDTSLVNGYVSVPNCTLGAVTTIQGGTSQTDKSVKVDCPDMGFSLSGTKQMNAPLGVSYFENPPLCGTLIMSGKVDWTKVSTFALDCYNSRAQFHFRGQSMDRVMVQFEKDQNGTNKVDAYASVLGCKVGNEAVTTNNGAWQTKAEIVTTCPEYGFEVKALIAK